MAFKYNTDNIGYFIEKDFKLEYTYRLTKNQWALSKGYTHEVDCGFDSVRYARVKKTVVYMLMDEDKPEHKWYIKNIKCRFLPE